MAVSHLRNTPITGKSYTTPVDATLAEALPKLARELRDGAASETRIMRGGSRELSPSAPPE
ncbi:hypothetical protein [Micromonospora aurantiaca (nom. illeg.)]|uniref:hypothetical protein n=1 Tax=Micromonospora aurantiaca (nom. illeg.) TaxID=47850 RepID=UPI0037ABC82D